MKYYKLFQEVLRSCMPSLFAACMAACATAPQAVDLPEDCVRIREQSDRFSQAYMSSDIEMLLSIYTFDAVLAPPNQPFLIGSQSLSKFLVAPDGREVVEHKIVPKSIIIYDRYAYDWGHTKGLTGPIGNPKTFSTKYLMIWRKDEDGVWKIFQDMWNGVAKNSQSPVALDRSIHKEVAVGSSVGDSSIRCN